MAPKKAVKKMDLGAFLQDESHGGNSWADAEVDVSSIGIAHTTAAIPDGQTQGSMYGSRAQGSGESAFSASSGGFREERRERVEYPVPDKPPYKAKISNLPWEIDESAVVQYFENMMQANDIVEEIDLPIDRDTNRLKGFAFVTFKERAALEEALKISTSDFEGRRIFVNVAAPRNTNFDGDWRSGRGGPLGGRDDGREQVELDWGAARGQQLPPREHRERPDRGDRPPRDQGPDLDWGAARGQQLPPREPRERFDRPERSERPPRDQGPELDWGSARGQQLPPREPRERIERTPREPREPKNEPELNWGAARGQKLPPREPRVQKERTFSPKAETTQDFDWSRGKSIPKKTFKKNEEKKDVPKPQKSTFSVLDIEGEDEDTLEAATEKLSVKEDDGWNVVGK